MTNEPDSVPVTTDPELKDGHLLTVIGAFANNGDAVLQKTRLTIVWQNGWIGPWLSRSLLGFRYKKPGEQQMTDWVDKLTKWAGIFFIGASALPAVYHEWHTEIFIAIPVLYFIWSLYSNFKRMLILGDPFFNIVAYQKFRVNEYQLVHPYINDPHFSFKEVHHLMSMLYQKHKDGPLNVITRELELFKQAYEVDKARLEAENTAQRKLLTEADNEIDELDEQAALLGRQVEINENGYNFAISLLFRLLGKEQSLFKSEDLKVVSDFSLFEIDGDHLHMLAELGTTETPFLINIHDPRYQHYSSVKLAKSTNMIETAVSDREGRKVSSYKFQLDSGRCLTYNFHFDSTDSNMYAIIESKEMFRLIRSICLHLEERGLLTRRMERDATA